MDKVIDSINNCYLPFIIILIILLFGKIITKIDLKLRKFIIGIEYNDDTLRKYRKFDIIVIIVLIFFGILCIIVRKIWIR